MIDIQKQIDYWINGASEDIKTAELLIQGKRILHGLFFCHLVVEKAIKANLVKVTNEIAPRSHNLIYLSERAELSFDDETQIFLGILMKYQLQGRYPDYNPLLPDLDIVQKYYERTNTLFEWLKQRL